MGRFLVVAAGFMIAASSAFGADRQEFKTTPLAEAFGQLPSLSDVRMAPDGTKISYLIDEVDGRTILGVLDLNSKEAHALAEASFGDFDLRWCGWANAERLICEVQGIDKYIGLLRPYTRMFAINADGSKQVWFLDRDQVSTQYAALILDLLSDDPENVVLQREVDGKTKLQRVNIYNNHSDTIAWGREFVDGWMTDGHGEPRIRMIDGEDRTRWDYTLAGSEDWNKLYEIEHDKDHPIDLTNYFEPAGFGDNPNLLYFFKPFNGHRALWQRDLTKTGDDAESVVFARDDVDVDSLGTIGKYRRAYSVRYTTDYAHVKMFDAGIDKIQDDIEKTIPGKSVTVYDESWDRRYYLVEISGDNDPGVFYRLDYSARQLMKLAPAFPKLEGRTMGKMTPIEYAASDGTKIPAYLTLPPGKEAKGLPLIIMPHGGPQSRDEWRFDPLVQYFAAMGYAVLQSNYRGSAGFGNDWQGEGGYKEWRQVISDLTDGARSVIADGTADPNRVCAVGWSYGGYAALLSAVEAKDLYKCVVSIAGVTDPSTEIRENRYYTNYRVMRDWLGAGNKDVIEAGSPLRRADEFQVPVLLFHGDKDLNVSVKNSQKLNDALRKLDKPVEYVEYEDAQHAIWRSLYRIDMLTRIGEFLGKYIGAADGASAKSAASEN